MTKKSAPPEMPISLLKIGTCPTLSGRSELTYHIGSNSDGEVYIRVVQNSSNGQFNADWVPVPLIEKLLTAHPAEKPMTSRVMQPIFRSKSSNSPAFLFAAILSEGMVKVGTEKGSGYILGDIDAFKQAISALIASDTNLAAAVTAGPEAIKRKRKESA